MRNLATSILLALLLVSAASRPLLAGPRPPSIINPKELDALLNGEEGVKRYLAQGRTPERLFNAAMYYFLNLVDLYDELDKRKGPRKRFMDTTIELLEEADRASPQNPVVVAFLGNAYGLKVTFSGFPALLAWSKKCQAELNRAVRISNGDPEVRLLRLRSFVHFPYQYYADVREVILDDAGAVLKWLGEIEAAKGSDPGLAKVYDNYAIDLKNEVYLLLGQYFDEQVKDKSQAVSYLKKADGTCWKYCQQAKALLAKLN